MSTINRRNFILGAAAVAAGGPVVASAGKPDGFKRQPCRWRFKGQGPEYHGVLQAWRPANPVTGDLGFSNDGACEVFDGKEWLKL